MHFPIVTARRHKQIWLIVATFAFMTQIAPAMAMAYNDDGHFYTVVSIAHAHLPPYNGHTQDDAVLMALCAQIPDLAKEYDAVSLRVRTIPSITGSFWGMFSSCWGTDVCHMVTVHHYLHGLTDGKAEDVTRAAKATLRALLRDLETGKQEEHGSRVCAAGFAIHLLGDSFAHRRLSTPTRMYAPGMGHFRDNHDPDFILFNPDRSHNYVAYAQALDETLQSQSAPSRWTTLRELLSQMQPGAHRDNLYNEKRLRDAFLNTLRADGTDHTPIWAPYKPPLESGNEDLVLSRTCKDVLDGYQVRNVNCNTVWKLYRQAVVQAFAQEKIKPTCDTDDGWSDGVSP